MSLRVGGVQARIAIAVLLIVVCLLPACGRKAKPQPLWGKSPTSRLQSQTR
jgi:hypothetical protein